MARAGRTLWLSFVPSKAGNKSPMWNVPSLYQEEETSLLPKTGNFGPRRFVISLLIFYPKPKPLLACHVFTNLLFLCLKGIKAAYFGHFSSPISMVPPYTWIKMCFFLYLLLNCLVSISLLVQPQKLQRDRGEISPSQHSSFYKAWNWGSREVGNTPKAPAMEEGSGDSRKSCWALPLAHRAAWSKPATPSF